MPSQDDRRPLLFSIALWAVFVAHTLGCVALSPLAYVVLRLWGHDRGQASRLMIWVYARIWMRLLGLFVPVRLDTGTRHTATSPCIFVANHSSFFDSYGLGAQPVTQIASVVRGWPFRIPLFGPFMRGAQYIDSGAVDSEQFMEQGARLLAGGTSILCYPEGTRSRTGRMGRFRAGAFHLSVQTGVPIVPICFRGMGALLPPKQWRIRPVEVGVTTLAPVHPPQDKGEHAHRALRSEVRQRMQRYLEIQQEPVSSQEEPCLD